MCVQQTQQCKSVILLSLSLTHTHSLYLSLALSLSHTHTHRLPSTTLQRNRSLCRCRHILSPVAIFSLSLSLSAVHIFPPPATSETSQLQPLFSLSSSPSRRKLYVIALQLSNRICRFAKGAFPIATNAYEPHPHCYGCSLSRCESLSIYICI